MITSLPLKDLVLLPNGSEVAERVIVIHLLGYKPWEEILKFFKEADKANASNQKVSLVILSYISDQDRARVLRMQLPISIYDVRSLRLNVSYRSHCLPSGLEGVHYPLSPILRRREYEPVYTLAEQQAFDRLELASCLGLMERDRFRVMFEAVKEFVDAALSHGAETMDSQLMALAEAWAARLWLESASSKSNSNILYASGLFIPDKSGHRIEPYPIAGVISAYLDAVYYCSEGVDKKRADQVRQSLVAKARSRRSLPRNHYRNSVEVIAWLALMMSAYFGKSRTVDTLINAVARIDLPMALDLHSMRDRPSASRNTVDNTITEKIFRHGKEHGNSVPVQFMNALDRAADRRRPMNPDLNRSIAGTSQATELLRSAPNVDLLATLLASCAIPARKRLSDADLWRAVVPTRMQKQLRVLGESFRKNSVETPSGIRVSVDVLKIQDLTPIFPNINRSSRPSHHVLELSWLTAYVLAIGCGARLPSREEMVEIFEDKRIQATCLGIREMSGNSRDLQALARFEWLRQNDSVEVTGTDFLGHPPPLFQMVVPKAYIFRRDNRQMQKCQVSFNAKVTAEPSRLQLAACRLAFLPTF